MGWAAGRFAAGLTGAAGPGRSPGGTGRPLLARVEPERGGGIGRPDAGLGDSGGLAEDLASGAFIGTSGVPPWRDGLFISGQFTHLPLRQFNTLSGGKDPSCVEGCP